MMEGVTVHPLKHIVVPKGDIYHALKSTDEVMSDLVSLFLTDRTRCSQRLETP